MRRIREAAEFVVAELAEAGFTQPHRFYSMGKALRGPERTIESEDPQFPAAREAIRDIRLMEFCLETLRGGIDAGPLRSKLKTAIGDPISPTAIPRSSPAGRNAQSELFVAAICQAAGLAPRFLEPDIVVRIGDANHAIAVKRPCSEGALDRRIREGIRQIRRSGLPGVVAIDGTLLSNPANLELRGQIPLDAMGDAAYSYVRALAKERLDRWKADVRGAELVAIVFQFHVLQNRSGTDWGLNTLTVPLNPNEKNSARTRAFRRFESEFSKGVPVSKALWRRR